MPLALTLHELINRPIKYCFIICLAFFCFGFLGDNEPLKVGSLAPDFSTKLFNNKDFKLSNLKGSYTLVQFWASWDLPSLKNNIDLTKTYKNYKDIKFIDSKKFTIVSISIDQKPETYGVVVTREAYPWPYFICDYNGWKSPLVDSFNVDMIPCNFLLNPKGVIIARNLFDNQLEAELNKYLKN